MGVYGKKCIFEDDLGLCNLFRKLIKLLVYRVCLLVEWLDGRVIWCLLL